MCVHVCVCMRVCVCVCERVCVCLCMCVCVASTTNMYTLASVRLLSFWLTATCSSAVKAYTYAYHTCVKRSRVYTLPNVYGHVMFHPVFNVSLPRARPVQLNARNKSRNGEGLGPRLWEHNVPVIVMLTKCQEKGTVRPTSYTVY